MMQKSNFNPEINLIKSYVKSWEKLNPDEIQFERLAGLSNMIWKVSTKDQYVSPSTLVFRQFGQGLVDRDQDNYIFQEISKTGMGPSCYALNTDFRIEEFYDSRQLHYKEVNKKFMRRNLAKSIGNLHRLHIDRLDQKPMILKMLEERELIQEFEKKCQQKNYSEIEKKFLWEIQSLASEDEINFLLEVVPKDKESVVFSHNDLHSANILLCNKTDKIILIDFEYGAYNYRAYDIANLLNESMFNYDVKEYPYYTCEEQNYPTYSDMIDFIKYYLFYFKFGQAEYDDVHLLNDESYLKTLIEEKGNIKEFNQEVEKIFEEVRVCAMLSHYYWTIWSVVKSKNPEIKFDYIHYAYTRYKIYSKLKEDFYYADYPQIEKLLISQE